MGNLTRIFLSRRKDGTRNQMPRFRIFRLRRMVTKFALLRNRALELSVDDEWGNEKAKWEIREREEKGFRIPKPCLFFFLRIRSFYLDPDPIFKSLWVRGLVFRDYICHANESARIDCGWRLREREREKIPERECGLDPIFSLNPDPAMVSFRDVG